MHEQYKRMVVVNLSQRFHGTSCNEGCNFMGDPQVKSRPSSIAIRGRVRGRYYCSLFPTSRTVSCSALMHSSSVNLAHSFNYWA